jgi:microspherule protein 1
MCTTLCNLVSLRLIQINDLVSVHRGVKFTCHFTLAEVQDRWNALMYDPIISKLALSAIKNLHPEVSE